MYDVNSNRLTFALAPELEDKHFKVVSAGDFQKDMESKEVRSIYEKIPSGELIRTIETVPFGVRYKDAEAFVVSTVLISLDLSKNMASISRGVEEYQQMKLLKKPIQGMYLIILSIVALLVVFCAIWFGLYLAKSITIPIMELAKGTRRIAEGDLKFRISMVADDEIGSLVDSFNKMTRDLQIGREQLEHSAKTQREQNFEI